VAYPICETPRLKDGLAAPHSFLADGAGLALDELAGLQKRLAKTRL
jgi:hypothetical protein